MTWNDRTQLTTINYKVTVQALVDVLVLRTVFDASIVSLHVVVDKKYTTCSEAKGIQAASVTWLNRSVKFLLIIEVYLYRSDFINCKLYNN